MRDNRNSSNLQSGGPPAGSEKWRPVSQRGTCVEAGGGRYRGAGTGYASRCSEVATASLNCVLNDPSWGYCRGCMH